MPNLISQRVHDSLVKSVEILLEERKDSLTSATVPVDIVIAKELRLPLRQEAKDALIEMSAKTAIYDTYRLTDYAEALMSYSPGKYSIKKKPTRNPEPSPVSEDGDAEE